MTTQTFDFPLRRPFEAALGLLSWITEVTGARDARRLHSVDELGHHLRHDIGVDWVSVLTPADRNDPYRTSGISIL